MLMHDGDAERGGGLRRGEAYFPAFDQDASFGRLARAADLADQRRFAGAVLAEQRMDFAAPHVEVDTIERPNARELFDETLDRKKYFARGRRRRSVALLQSLGALDLRHLQFSEQLSPISTSAIPRSRARRS